MDTPIDELLKVPGISRVLVGKLKSIGLEYLEDLVLFNPEELVERAEIADLRKAEFLIKSARKILGRKRRSLTAREYLRLMESREFFTTLVKAIDGLLGGGIRVIDVYEFAGEFGTGKTQLAHQLSVTVQLPPSRGGLGGKTVYIDTEGTFSPERIYDIAEGLGLSDALDNVFVARPVNVLELEDVVIEDLPSLIRRGVRLIVIDSIIALYRAEFKGLEMLAYRQQRINYLIDWLKRYSYRYQLAVVYTNQVLSQPVPWGFAYKVPAGGNIIAHAATHRFLLKKTGSEWVMECLDSPTIPRGKAARFRITKHGLRDVE